jgi:glutathione peroxidase
MMGKVSVTGPTMCELYKFLTQKSKNGIQDSQVDWNFQKYLINEFGELIKVFPSKITPFNTELLSLLN